MMTLSVDVAGVDLPSAPPTSSISCYELMDRLARASTVAHAVGDKAAIIADGDDALADVRARVLRARRCDGVGARRRFESGRSARSSSRATC